MSEIRFPIEGEKPFSESLIWQINLDYYNQAGTDAWSSGIVPHHLTSNSVIGKTYAELIMGFLKDLARKGQNEETVYLLELGAGHGRLAFHILQHFEQLSKDTNIKLPPICYVLSDIVEKNLDFFSKHPQFQEYIKNGILDVAYFDAVNSDELNLRHSGKHISKGDLKQPMLVVANYFFDSIPTDVLHFDNTKVSEVSVSIDASEDPAGQPPAALIKNLDLIFHEKPIQQPHYENPFLNELIEKYRLSVFNSYLFFPKTGLKCLENIRQFSEGGLLLLSIDKGYHQLHDLENQVEPDLVSHGSLSFWVNFHALGSYCEKTGGKAVFPEFSTFHLELGCLMFLPEADTFTETLTAFRRYVNEYGPDDFTGIKKFSYKHVASMDLRELVGVLRLGAYDSTMFIQMLPRIKQVYTRITFNDRNRLAQTMRQTWKMHFHLAESEDLAFEIGGMLYALGFYDEALEYFVFSVERYGNTADEFYNRALCYYQLRKDDLFLRTMKEAKVAFPDFAGFRKLDKLDLGAA